MPSGKLDKDVNFASSIIVEDGPTAVEFLVAQADAKDELIDDLLELMRQRFPSGLGSEARDDSR
ncbi:hypothetical protein [Couchioplanes azureus]|nr:hypothetical protein [Couchioplanes caeruleus]GGQ50353.1 hypothetical protein GCM10010166_18610 [Couchioplanes caeruleus subsp. azureus]